MRKLELRVDALKVESFETLPARGSVGTVLANQFGNPLDPFGPMDEANAPATAVQTCQGWNTCAGEKTCNFQNGCYTWDGGYTCNGAANCHPTENATCTCPAAVATVPEGGA